MAESNIKGSPRPATSASSMQDASHDENNWWQKEARNDGKYWDSLKHCGPLFPPPYKRLPKNVDFLYNGKVVRLSEPAEELARFYAELLENECIQEDVFRRNFFEEWRKVMNEEERNTIAQLDKCNFIQLQKYSKDDTRNIKQELKKEKETHGYCTIDGHRQKIENWYVEFPGLFQGAASNPKNGKVKKRILPEDVIINCSLNEKPDPPSDHKWKDVISNPRVTWLAKWEDRLQNKQKYMKLHPNSPLRGNLEREKYEKALLLHQHINDIRNSYRNDWEAEEIEKQQQGVALYLIDKLAFRVGHEKDEDTAACCSLRVEHVKIKADCVIEFKFHEKGYKPYSNEVKIEEVPFKKIQEFIKNKKTQENIFHCLDAYDLNKHLNSLIPSLTAKVFRTYNASITFQKKLDELTNSNDNDENKIASYNEAAQVAANLCNHQRTVSKRRSIDALTKELEQFSISRSANQSTIPNIETTKLFYLDPRITVAWCKKNQISVDRVTRPTEPDKFQWASATGPDFHYANVEQKRGKKLF